MQGADGEQCYVGLTKMFELVDCRCGVLCLWAVAGLSVVQPKLILWLMSWGHWLAKNLRLYGGRTCEKFMEQGHRGNLYFFLTACLMLYRYTTFSSVFIMLFEDNCLLLPIWE